jgi:hypothetical protein
MTVLRHIIDRQAKAAMAKKGIPVQVDIDKLSGPELSAAVATEVMGWHRGAHTEWRDTNGCSAAWPSDNNPGRSSDAYEPHANVAQAIEAAEYAVPHNKGAWRIDRGWGDGAYCATEAFIYGIGGCPLARAEGSTPAEALCRALVAYCRAAKASQGHDAAPDGLPGAQEPTQSPKAANRPK